MEERELTHEERLDRTLARIESTLRTVGALFLLLVGIGGVVAIIRLVFTYPRAAGVVAGIVFWATLLFLSSDWLAREQQR